MATYRVSANMEFVRSADKGFEEGIKIAGDLGYRWVEPMVHTGWELLSEVHYFHSFSMEEDPLLMREICDRHGVRVSSLSGHSPLMKPEAAVPRLTRAIVLADAVGAGFVNTDEMVKPDWMDDDAGARRHALHATEGCARGRPPWHLCLHRAPRRLHQDRRWVAADRRAGPFSLDPGQLGYWQCLSRRRGGPVRGPGEGR